MKNTYTTIAALKDAIVAVQAAQDLHMVEVDAINDGTTLDKLNHMLAQAEKSRSKSGSKPKVKSKARVQNEHFAEAFRLAHGETGTEFTTADVLQVVPAIGSPQRATSVVRILIEQGYCKKTGVKQNGRVVYK